MKPRAIVVEDAPELRKLFCEQLKHLGYSCTGAENANKVIELLDGGHQFDLLLTDVVLPEGVNGQELSDYVKGHSPKTATVFTSGYPTGILARQGIAPVSRDRFLQKPFSLRDLENVIAQIN